MKVKFLSTQFLMMDYNISQYQVFNAPTLVSIAPMDYTVFNDELLMIKIVYKMILAEICK